MTDLFEQPDHATPLAPEEMRGLIPAYIAYRSDLNEAEQENIARAQDWALLRRRDLLSEKFVTDLDRRMLGDVWRWAGKFRASECNLGIPFYQIPVALRQLLADAKAWIECQSYPPDEIGVRFHLAMALGQQRFSWARASVKEAGEVRRRYIAALNGADNHDIGPLLAFARS